MDIIHRPLYQYRESYSGELYTKSTKWKNCLDSRIRNGNSVFTHIFTNRNPQRNQ